MTDIINFRPMVPQWCTIDRADVQDITDSINALRIALAEKSWWEEWPTFAGIFLAAILAFASNWIFEYRKERKAEAKTSAEVRKAQAREINAAIMSFTNDMIKLLSFKKQKVKPYIEDVEKIIAAKKKGLPTTIATLQTCTLLFQFMERITLNETSYAEKLAFMATHRPIYLIALHQVHGYFISINYDIEQRNNFIRRHMEKSVYEDGVTIQQIGVAIDMLSSYGKALEMHVDAAIGFMIISIEYMVEYASKWLPGERIKKLEIKEEFKAYMPSDSDFAGFREMVKESLAAEEKRTA